MPARVSNSRQAIANVGCEMFGDVCQSSKGNRDREVSSQLPGRAKDLKPCQDNERNRARKSARQKGARARRASPSARTRRHSLRRVVGQGDARARVRF